MEADIGKLDINKLVNIPTGLNNLETKVDKLKTVAIDLKKIRWCSDASCKQDGDCVQQNKYKVQ